ncbi:MAG: glycosyl transferase, partial [Jatrophihabitans sp.]
KSVGRRASVVNGTDLASVRMYLGWTQLRDGYGKSLWSAFGSPVGAVAVLAALVGVYVVPAVAALRGSRVGAFGYTAAVVSRAVAARASGGRAWPDALAHPVSILVFGHLTLSSVLAQRFGRLRWKGRPVGTGVGSRRARRIQGGVCQDWRP